MTKVYSRIPPPKMKNFRFEMTKVYSRIPPKWRTSDLGWPKFTPEYPPKMKNFRFEMTKVYSGIPPQNEKLQIWNDQSLLRNTPQWKTSDLRWPKFTVEWTPPKWKTSDLGWPKFTPEYPPPKMKNFRFGMTKVYSGIPPPQNEKLQIWDDQSLLRNTPPPGLESGRSYVETNLYPTVDTTRLTLFYQNYSQVQLVCVCVSLPHQQIVTNVMEIIRRKKTRILSSDLVRGPESTFEHHIRWSSGCNSLSSLPGPALGDTIAGHGIP